MIQNLLRVIGDASHMEWRLLPNGAIRSKGLNPITPIAYAAKINYGPLGRHHSRRCWSAALGATYRTLTPEESEVLSDAQENVLTDPARRELRSRLLVACRLKDKEVGR